MEEQTTTATQPVDEGAQAQPNEQVEAAGSQQEPVAAEATKPEVSDNLEWLKSKGIDPSSQEAVEAIAEKWRNAEREMHNKLQSKPKDKLEETVSGDTQQQIADAEASGQYDAGQIALARVQAMELAQSVNSFWATNPDAKQHEAEMVSLINERPEVGNAVRSGVLSIGDLYAMVRGSGQSLQQAQAQGGQQALQQLANKQTATAVQGAATTSAMSPAKGDPILDLWAN